MKNIIIFLSVFIFAICILSIPNPIPSRINSESVAHRAIEACKNEPELDGRRTYCVLGTIVMICKKEKLDIAICGKIEEIMSQ